MVLRNYFINFLLNQMLKNIKQKMLNKKIKKSGIIIIVLFVDIKTSIVLYTGQNIFHIKVINQIEILYYYKKKCTVGLLV